MQIEFSRAIPSMTPAPRALRAGDQLLLEIVGGTGPDRHAPRTFTIPIQPSHLTVLREDLARHLIAWSVLSQLCIDAGPTKPLDELAAFGILDTILLGPQHVDEFLSHTTFDRALLARHGADFDLLERGQVMDAMRNPDPNPDYERAQNYMADRERTKRGVSLSALDTAVLRFTGQYLHRSGRPHRDRKAVKPGLRPEVNDIIAAAEQACAGMTIARDPRKGTGGTDTRDWQRIQDTVGKALHRTHPKLGSDAVTAIARLLCTEAAKLARKGPFEPDAAAMADSTRVLTFNDNRDVTMTWRPGAARPAIEEFWQFVAARADAGVTDVELEDEAAGESIVLMSSRDLVVRVRTISPGDADNEPALHMEYGSVTELSDYRKLVHDFIDGGYSALDQYTQWFPSYDALAQARH